MYKPNKKHLQPPLLSNVQTLPEKYRQRLEHSWAGGFYRDFFCRMQEDAFACLYADHPSRPNVAVNVLVGLDVLKAGFGWSDEELFDHFLFDVQVRYALGYHNLAEDDFDIRTLYNFRRRLSQYQLENRVNLLKKCFEDITDQQIMAFKVKTDLQRMDSTQIASNILDSSRLQLAAEVLQRLAGLMAETERSTYAQQLAPYLTDTTNQFVYRVKGKQAVEQHLQQIGELLYLLLKELKQAYETEPFWPVAQRFFAENYQVEEAQVFPREGKDLSSGCLQSLDDLEATYRQKGNRFFKGYVTNLTETCNDDNQLQLITAVQVQPNNVSDPALLLAALPDLTERTQLKQLHTDGSYGSPDVDQAMREHHVEHIPTAIRGTYLDPNKLHLSAYELQQNEQGQTTQITCPNGQTVPVQATPSGKSFLARFEPSNCQTCPFHLENRCRILWRKKCAKYQMDFTQGEADAAVRRRRVLANKQSSRNLRAAVEAAMRSIKHPFGDDKLPVRGLFRMFCMMLGSAAMTNIRRITRHQKDSNVVISAFSHTLERIWNCFLGLPQSYLPVLSWISC